MQSQALDISVSPFQGGLDVSLDLVSSEEGLLIYRFSIHQAEPNLIEPITLRWKIPYLNGKGVWKSDGIHDKRQQYDWELEHFYSRISVNAPVISVFGLQDQNLITFACQEAIELVEMNALLREEDNFLYCHLTLFPEPSLFQAKYETHLRIDLRKLPFGTALQETAAWWASFPELTPTKVPALARAPLYSTWYNYHQSLDEEILMAELKVAQELGYELVIIDDGWQTLDSQRGYDYTGDWEPERMPEIKAFVDQVHDLGMKVGLWFSVPFCGKKSHAYRRFQGKFLTENHRWAPVFDPRFPEVREYLVGLYCRAVREWGMDALKLDFIDDFRMYPETVKGNVGGRDFASINEGVDALLTATLSQLKEIRPDIAIEFRQRYVGPAVRKYGNMFRAFDCPNDPITNRIRTTDVKLLCGETAVHSDPITWHPDDSVENAALQLLNGLFSVPQISVELTKLTPPFLEMLRFYTRFWKQHQAILMDGHFEAYNPLGNYPRLSSEMDGTAIQVAYDDLVLPLKEIPRQYLFNGSDKAGIIIRVVHAREEQAYSVLDCQGKEVEKGTLSLLPGLYEFDVPIAGYLLLISKN